MQRLLSFFADKNKLSFPEKRNPKISDFPLDKRELINEIAIKSGGFTGSDTYHFGTFYSGHDILKLGFFPQSCTSYSILAHDLLKHIEIPNCIVQMLFKESTHENLKRGYGSQLGDLKLDHVIIEYKNSQGRPIRCDPKWQERTDESGKIFFRRNPQLRDAFVNGERLLHGGVGYVNNEGVFTQLEYDPPPKIIRSYLLP